MKYYNIAILFSIIVFSCKEVSNKSIETKDQVIVEPTTNKDSINKVEAEKKEQIQNNLNEISNNPKFYSKAKIKEYNFKTNPLKQDYLIMSDPSMSDSLKIEKFFVNDSLMKEFYLKTDTSFCYRFVNYNLIFEDERIRVFTTFCNYDYFKSIFLITADIKSKSLIDSEVIASIMGDAGDLTEISTSFTDSISFKVTTHKKRLTKIDTFETVGIEEKLFKISSNGQIN